MPAGSIGCKAAGYRSKELVGDRSFIFFENYSAWLPVFERLYNMRGGIFDGLQ